MDENEIRTRRHIERFDGDRSARPVELDEPPMSIKLKYSNIILFGLVIIFLGLFLTNLLLVIEDSSADLRKWFLFFQQLSWFGGALLIAGAMMMNGLKGVEMKPAIRVALIIGAVAILVFMLTNSGGSGITNVNVDLPDWYRNFN